MGLPGQAGIAGRCSGGRDRLRRRSDGEAEREQSGAAGRDGGGPNPRRSQGPWRAGPAPLAFRVQTENRCLARKTAEAETAEQDDGRQKRQKRYARDQSDEHGEGEEPDCRSGGMPAMHRHRFYRFGFLDRMIRKSSSRENLPKTRTFVGVSCCPAGGRKPPRPRHSGART